MLMRTLALLGGLFWIAWHLWFIFSGVDFREIGATILAAAAAVALMAAAVFKLWRGAHIGKPGQAGALVLLGGMIAWITGAALSGLGANWAWLLAIGGEMITTLGLAGLGLGALAEAPRPLWKWIPLFLAPVYFISFTTTGASFPAWAPAYTPEWFGVLYGAGWVLIGGTMPKGGA